LFAARVVDGSRRKPLHVTAIVTTVVAATIGVHTLSHWYKNRPQPLIIPFDSSSAPIELSGRSVDRNAQTLHLSPQINGVSRWDDDRTLSFRPDHDWLIDQKYEVQLARRTMPPMSNRKCSSSGQATSRLCSSKPACHALRAQTFGHDTIPFGANADGDVRTLHWFVDNAYVCTSPPDGSVTWTPARTGAFMVRAVDDRGRADSRERRRSGAVRM
jgi:membrane carboxypeptidase/penicillin-binding protein PbpC